MKSTVVKRSIVINNHKTSVSLEDSFWLALKQIAQTKRLTLSSQVAAIDEARESGNLSSAIRTFVLGHFSAAVANVGDQASRSETPTALPKTKVTDLATKRFAITKIGSFRVY